MGKQKSPTKRRAEYGRAARRRKRSKRKYTLYYLLALVMMLCIGIALSLTVFFKIENIEVTGSERYARGELIDTAQIKPGDNLFRIDIKAVGKKLVDKYSYIAQVRVQRVLPNVVYLHITEAQPKAMVETAQGYLVLDERGRVLESGLPQLAEGYSRVIGFETEGLSVGHYLPGPEMDRLKQLIALQDSLKANGLTKISLIDIRNPIDMRLLFDGRVIVEMGGQLDVDYKVRAAKSVIDLSVTADTIGTLDVSARPVMRLRELNIYEPSAWPFPQALLSDYERVVIKQQWWNNATDSSEEAPLQNGG